MAAGFVLHVIGKVASAAISSYQYWQILLLPLEVKCKTSSLPIISRASPVAYGYQKQQHIQPTGD
jgi:hypothetical protein